MHISLGLLALLLAAVFVLGYFVGARNPPAAIKKDVAEDAKNLLKKVP